MICMLLLSRISMFYILLQKLDIRYKIEPRN